MHKRIYKRSTENLQNRVRAFSESGVYVWFSSNTAINKYGSVMVYVVIGTEEQTWYASLRKNTEWYLDKVKGTSLDSALEFIPLNPIK